jgi:FecR protein
MNWRVCLLALITITAELASWFPNQVNAAAPSEARITRVGNSVQLLCRTAAARRASVNNIIGEETTVRTGKTSRGELTFSDETVVRLAANTAFNFKDGTHGLNLREGAALIQATKKANGATVHAAGVAAAVTGATVMIEYHPGGVCKFLVLEGTGRLYRPGHLGDSVLVGPGQVVLGNPNAAVSDPVDFDISRFTKTSCLISDFPPLRSEHSIVAEGQKQQREKSKKTLIDTNLVIFGGGTRMSLVGPGPTDAVSRTTAAVAPATPRRAPNLSPEAVPASQ